MMVGDVIYLTAKLLNISPLEACKYLNDIFSLGIDFKSSMAKITTNRYKQKQEAINILEEEKAKLVEREKEVKVLEKHKEKALETYKEEEKILENKQLSEVAVQKYYRKTKEKKEEELNEN